MPDFSWLQSQNDVPVVLMCCKSLKERINVIKINKDLPVQAVGEFSLEQQGHIDLVYD